MKVKLFSVFAVFCLLVFLSVPVGFVVAQTSTPTPWWWATPTATLSPTPVTPTATALPPSSYLNVVSNPSFEIDLSTCSIEGAGAWGRDSYSHYVGSYSLRGSVNDVESTYVQCQLTGLVPFSTVRVSAYMRATGGSAEIGMFSAATWTWSDAVSSSSWTRVQFSALVGNSGNPYLRLKADSLSSGSAIVYFDGLQVEYASVASQYCDGDQSNGDWLGDAHDSWSVCDLGFATPTPTVTPLSTSTPTPVPPSTSTPTPTPTRTPMPTFTPVPFPTPGPTSTPLATNTPYPLPTVIVSPSQWISSTWVPGSWVYTGSWGSGVFTPSYAPSGVGITSAFDVLTFGASALADMSLDSLDPGVTPVVTTPVSPTWITATEFSGQPWLADAIVSCGSVEVSDGCVARCESLNTHQVLFNAYAEFTGFSGSTTPPYTDTGQLCFVNFSHFAENDTTDFFFDCSTGGELPIALMVDTMSPAGDGNAGVYWPAQSGTNAGWLAYGSEMYDRCWDDGQGNWCEQYYGLSGSTVDFDPFDSIEVDISGNYHWVTATFSVNAVFSDVVDVFQGITSTRTCSVTQGVNLKDSEAAHITHWPIYDPVPEGVSVWYYGVLGDLTVYGVLSPSVYVLTSPMPSTVYFDYGFSDALTETHLIDFSLLRDGEWITSVVELPTAGIQVKVTEGPCYTLIPAINDPFHPLDSAYQIFPGAEICLWYVEPSLMVPLIGDPLPYFVGVVGAMVVLLLYRMLRES